MAKKRKPNCGACGKKLDGGLYYFCHPCFMKLPAKERMSLSTMHRNGQETDSKVAKCVRILKEQNP